MLQEQLALVLESYGHSLFMKDSQGEWKKRALLQLWLFRELLEFGLRFYRVG
jgi:hypothetical protein